MSEALKAVLLLRKAPDYWLAATSDSDNAAVVAQRFWIVVLVGMFAAPFIGRCAACLIAARWRRRASARSRVYASRSSG
jgi:hypothetical protein